MKIKYLFALIPLLLTPTVCRAVPINLDLALLIASKALPSSATSGASATSVFTPAVGTFGRSFSGSASSSAAVSVSGNSDAAASAQAGWDISFVVTQPGLTGIDITYSYANSFNIHTSVFANGHSDGDVQFLNNLTNMTVSDHVGGACDTTIGSCSKSDAHANTISFIIPLPAEFSIIDLTGQVSADSSVSSGFFSDAGGNGNANITYSIVAFIPEPSTASLLAAALVGLSLLLLRRHRLA